MNKLNSRNWMRVRINGTKKVITFTNDVTYKTKSECEKDINYTQYIAINQKTLDKMLNEGWTIADQETKEVKSEVIETEEIKTLSGKSEWIPKDLSDNPEIQKACKDYTKSKLVVFVDKPKKPKKSFEVMQFLASGNVLNPIKKHRLSY